MRKWWIGGALVVALVVQLAGCGGGSGSGADGTSAGTSTRTDTGTTSGTATDLDTPLRAYLASNGVVAPAEPAVSDALYNLGSVLFQSTLLSGTRSVSCASCHPIGNAGLDNLVLSIGINGSGTPPNRTGSPLIHRNAPDLLNKVVGNPRFMFWDGRVSVSNGVYTSPAGAALPAGLGSLAAVQALFPLLSRPEMLGYNDPADANELADLNPAGATVEQDPLPVWNGIMARLRADTQIAGLLQQAYPDTPLSAIGIAAVGNALAAFESRRWYAFGIKTYFHGYMAGVLDIPDSAKRGGLLFFGKAGCAACHGGPLLSDQKFHNLAVPQIGPGFAAGAAMTPPHDLGRYGVTGSDADKYAFLTPSLWEVKNTWPYFHNGVFATLEEAVRHHLDPAVSAMAFRCSDALRSGGNVLPCQDSTTAPALYADLVARLDPALKSPPRLSDSEFADLIAFLNQLTNGSNNSVR
ncbi:MAG: c-type cytochrome [Proteobacteria bacterium]|nr:c-type cytochrome [Pseudomonadota bacterium]